MLKIDDNLLQTIGLGGLPTEDKRGLLTHIYETLEMRVGMRLADQMTNEQLDEFETYFEAKDDAGAFKWLESNFPNYKDIVNEEFEKLKTEVQQSVPQILAAAQQNPAQPQNAPTPQVAAPVASAPQQPQFAPAPNPDSLQAQGQDAQAQGWPEQPVASPAPSPVADPYSPSPAPAAVGPTSQPQQAPAASPDQQAWAPAPQEQPWQSAAPAPQPYQPAPEQNQPQPPIPPAPTDVPPQPYQPMPPTWTPDQPQQGN